MSETEPNPWLSRLRQVRARIDAAARQAGRDPASIRLLAVSKTFPAEAVAALAACGQADFGENYVQEGAAKITALRAAGPQLRWPRLHWHFIGPLQSNKTREVAEQFDWVHAVDRLRLAQRLSAQRPAERDGQPLAPLQVCIQVNISGEASKSGVAPEAVAELAHAVAGLPHLRLRGLMCIPAPAEGLQGQRAPFARLRELLEELGRQGLALDTLSMGMSADLEAAVLEGATIVRVGTALFGSRPPLRGTHASGPGGANGRA
ncbi:MAG: YggS family pyridoxal phosphate-dependent enzyme [Betaproteobacteria bacterium]|nr:YggS family pyridoxal phosphate-dependent enzyme [Betaproteobacteria bacterium]